MAETYHHYQSSTHKTFRQQRVLRQLLSSWYGNRDRASAEMLRHMPGPVPISEPLRRIEEKLFSADDILLNKIRDKWSEIAGDAIARVASPVGAKNGILMVEVSHSAWLRELRGPTKEMLRKNMERLIGKDVCKDLNFVPVGRHEDKRGGRY